MMSWPQTSSFLTWSPRDVGAAHVAEPIAQRGVGQLLRDDGGDAPDAADEGGHVPGVLGRERGLLGREMFR